MSTLAVDALTDAVGTGSPDFPNAPRQAFYLSPLLITSSFIIPVGFNAMTAGPVEVDDDVEIEVSVGSTWSVI
jgi:hypothetical protein